MTPSRGLGWLETMECDWYFAGNHFITLLPKLRGCPMTTDASSEQDFKVASGGLEFRTRLSATWQERPFLKAVVRPFVKQCARRSVAQAFAGLRSA